MAVIASVAAILKYAAEYLGGVNDEPPRFMPPPNSIFWGVWWGVLIFLVIIFSGQASKFLYIDF